MKKGIMLVSTVLVIVFVLFMLDFNKYYPVSVILLCLSLFKVIDFIQLEELREDGNNSVCYNKNKEKL
ncbi:hypothetical protein [Enterococcus rivorum]|uniref:Uncharacterized protein n=1 Tax=Enterococcus rivorum TaxID=762845 RepID=A0A1E5L0T8_9ENTE|nr:hypothetical protein [Enterococcus rivorum]MBP2098794.1 hypothetical protein [Enterococcus rivorum]OEH83529.1 hypothetical protein BCR26_08595 [Enterococcus rivorum]